MTTHRPAGSVDLILTFGDPHPSGQPSPDMPFRMLIMGDFSGTGTRQDRTAQQLSANRRPIRVDRDNIQDLLSTLKVALQSPLLGDNAPPLTLKFHKLDDFHPDRLVDQIEPLRKLSDLRRRLANQATFPQAADEIRAWIQPRQPTETRPIIPESLPHQPGGEGSLTGGLLEHMLEQTPPPSVSDLRPTEWQTYLRSIVAPYAVSKEHPLAQALTAQVDAAMSQIMRAVLHHPEFQGLEAAWRGLSLLVDRLETDSQLQLYLLDLPKSELAADLLNRNDLHETELYRLLVHETVHTPGAHPWAVVGGVYTFDRAAEDMALLERVAGLCKKAGAPFLAAASPNIVGCPSFGTTKDQDDWQFSATQKETQDQWDRLRHLPEASYMGLALPRFLLRLPYGQETEPIGAFTFEEMADTPQHEDYCWGNPMFACLVLLGQAFAESSWQMNPGSIKDIEGLPLHVYQNDSGESVSKPCAEIWLTEHAAQHLLEQSVMPLLSFKDHDQIRLARFQSLAVPLQVLAGRWNER
jgi:type VI secretion system protein ImpC